MRAQQRGHCLRRAALLRDLGDLYRRARRLQMLNIPAAGTVGSVEANDPKPVK